MLVELFIEIIIGHFQLSIGLLKVISMTYFYHVRLILFEYQYSCHQCEPHISMKGMYKHLPTDEL